MATETKTKTGYRAISRFLIASPYKIRPVANMVRRKTYPEAISLLDNLPHKGARLIKKTVKSAASNALNSNKKLDEDMLYIREILIDEGPRLKRVWFRGRGRADMQMKRMSHITVVMGEIGEIGEIGEAGTAVTKAVSKSNSKKADK